MSDFAKRLTPPTLTRYQLRVLAAVPEAGVTVDELSRHLHGGWATGKPHTVRAIMVLAAHGLVEVMDDFVTPCEGTAENHVKAEQQQRMF